MNILFIFLAVLCGIGFIFALIYAFTRRNQNQIAGQQPAGNLCDGPIPLHATINIPAQELPINLWMGLYNPRRLVRILLSILAGMLLTLTLLFVYLAAQPANGATTAPAAQNQSVVTPAPVVTPPVPPLDPKTVVDPVNNKIDQSTQLLAGKIDDVNKNLTNHRQSSRRGYAIQNKKLDDIKAGVADLDISITSLRGELNIRVNELKTALGDSTSPEQINQLTTEVNNLRGKIDALTKKNTRLTTGDPD